MNDDWRAIMFVADKLVKPDPSTAGNLAKASSLTICLAPIPEFRANIGAGDAADAAM